jgi:hypothetical protein
MAKSKTVTTNTNTAFVADADQTNFLNALASNDFLYVAPAYAGPIAAAGLIEVNPEMVEEGTGNHAARITDEGRAYIAANGSATGTAPAEVAGSASSFEIEDDVPMVAASKGGRSNKYPFDDLPAPEYDTTAKRWKFRSFHVAATDDNKDPANNLASTVSAATDRFAELAFNTDGTPVMTERRQKNKETGEFEKVPTQAKNKTRVFTVRAVGATDPKGEGARVYRTDGLKVDSPAPTA